MEFTEEELAGLSEEERQAVTEPEETPLTPATEEAEEDGETEADAPGTDESVEGDLPPSNEDAPKLDTEDPEEPVEEPRGDSKPLTPVKPFVPVYQADTAPLEEIQGKLSELDKQLQDGDIDIVEYTRQRDPLIQARTKIELTQELNQQSAAQLWKHEQSLFFSQNKEYREDPVMNGALRAVFKTLDTEENAHKSGYELLSEAKAVVEKRFGAGKDVSATKDPEPPPTPKPRTPARETTQLPQTLADVIPADQNATQKDEFSHLDNLSGIDFEKALASLPPDQERRYLRGA